jgi:hypothetical protein
MELDNKYKIARELLLSLYEKGEGMSYQQKVAVYDEYLKSIRHLAYANYAKAQFDLAGHYEDIGYWGSQNPYYNPKRMIYWYKKASENGDSMACNNLANLYERGDLVPRDLNLALELYRRSAELGYEIGKENYKIMLREMSPKGKYGKDKLIKSKSA